MSTMTMFIEIHIKLVILLVIWCYSHRVCSTLPPCETPQYLELGLPGMVECGFDPPFYGVYWYNSTNYLHNDVAPFLYYTEGKRTGGGFTSGEFDIAANGSLVIPEVTLQHNHVFTVFMLKTKTWQTIPNYVDVVVIVRPLQPFPEINICDGQRTCAVSLSHPQGVSCKVRNSMPPIPLMFLKETSGGARRLRSRNHSTTINGIHTEQITLIDPLNEETIYDVISCVAMNASNLLEWNTSTVLVDNSDYILPRRNNASRHFIELGTTTTLTCLRNTSSMYIVWKKANDGELKTLAKTVIATSNLQMITSNEHQVEPTGELLIMNSVQAKDEGIYACVHGDGLTEEVEWFNISVYAMPSPPHLRIGGCNPDQYCTLPAYKAKELTCSLSNFRPNIELAWEYVDGTSVDRGILVKNYFTVEKNSETYNAFLSSELSFKGVKSESVRLLCSVNSNEASLPFQWTASVEILLPTNLSRTDGSNEYIEGETSKTTVILIAVVVVLVCTVVALAFFARFIWRRRRNGIQRQAQINDDITAGIPLLDILDRKATLQNELRIKYQSICESVGFLTTGREQNIQNMFIDGDIELRLINEDKPIWQKLASYHDIVDRSLGRNERIILTGGAGYGKSTLCRKLAYDWCTENKMSPLKDVDIFILMYMRYLGSNMSLCEAVRKFFLPGDSMLTANDIQQIITTSSAVIVLDGLNMFPQKEDFESTEIKNIMKKQTFANCQVVMTTRSEFKSKSIPASTKQMRLVGFDENAQNKYILEVVAKNQIKAESIKSFMASIPGIFAFCQVPLFFSLIVQLSYKRKLSTDISAKTITHFFSNIIQALENNSEGTTSFVRSHQKAFYQKCFEGLCSKNGLVWNKADFTKGIGTDLYQHHHDLGILVEEEVYESGSTNKLILARYSYDMKAKFFHHVFCEWFAAHHLADVAAKSSPKKLAEILQQVKPLDHQYVYRFACGLNLKAAGNIINYLMDTAEDGGNFAKLCIIETGQEGIDNTITVLRDICSRPITINKDDRKLLQRSMTQMLVLASDNKIPIQIVWIDGLKPYLNAAKDSLTFASGIKLPKLKTLNQLSIAENNRELSPENFKGILEFVALCLKVVNVRFRGCVLPRTVALDPTVQELRERQVSVDWFLPLDDKPCYRLNLSDGQWELNGEQMQDGIYQQVKREVNLSMKDGVGQDTIEDEVDAGDDCDNKGERN